MYEILKRMSTKYALYPNWKVEKHYDNLKEISLLL